MIQLLCDTHYQELCLIQPALQIHNVVRNKEVSQKTGMKYPAL